MDNDEDDDADLDAINENETDEQSKLLEQLLSDGGDSEIPDILSSDTEMSKGNVKSPCKARRSSVKSSTPSPKVERTPPRVRKRSGLDNVTPSKTKSPPTDKTPTRVPMTRKRSRTASAVSQQNSDTDLTAESEKENEKCVGPRTRSRSIRISAADLKGPEPETPCVIEEPALPKLSSSNGSKQTEVRASLSSSESDSDFEVPSKLLPSQSAVATNPTTIDPLSSGPIAGIKPLMNLFEPDDSSDNSKQQAIQTANEPNSIGQLESAASANCSSLFGFGLDSSDSESEDESIRGSESARDLPTNESSNQAISTEASASMTTFAGIFEKTSCNSEEKPATDEPSAENSPELPVSGTPAIDGKSSAIFNLNEDLDISSEELTSDTSMTQLNQDTVLEIASTENVTKTPVSIDAESSENVVVPVNIQDQDAHTVPNGIKSKGDQEDECEQIAQNLPPLFTVEGAEESGPITIEDKISRIIDVASGNQDEEQPAELDSSISFELQMSDDENEETEQVVVDGKRGNECPEKMLQQKPEEIKSIIEKPEEINHEMEPMDEVTENEKKLIQEGDAVPTEFWTSSPKRVAEEKLLNERRETDVPVVDSVIENEALQQADVDPSLKEVQSGSPKSHVNALLESENENNEFPPVADDKTEGESHHDVPPSETQEEAQSASVEESKEKSSAEEDAPKENSQAMNVNGETESTVSPDESGREIQHEQLPKSAEENQQPEPIAVHSKHQTVPDIPTFELLNVQSTEEAVITHHNDANIVLPDEEPKSIIEKQPSEEINHEMEPMEVTDVVTAKLIQEGDLPTAPAEFWTTSPKDVAEEKLLNERQETDVPVVDSVIENEVSQQPVVASSPKEVHSGSPKSPVLESANENKELPPVADAKTGDEYHRDVPPSETQEEAQSASVEESKEKSSAEEDAPKENSEAMNINDETETTVSPDESEQEIQHEQLPKSAEENQQPEQIAVHSIHQTASDIPTFEQNVPSTEETIITYSNDANIVLPVEKLKIQNPPLLMATKLERSESQLEPPCSFAKSHLMEPNIPEMNRSVFSPPAVIQESLPIQRSSEIPSLPGGSQSSAFKVPRIPAAAKEPMPSTLHPTFPWSKGVGHGVKRTAADDEVSKIK